jgi:hypothetical protein
VLLKFKWTQICSDWLPYYVFVAGMYECKLNTWRLSVSFFQLWNRRTDFDEISLRVRCEVLMVVTEDIWYMILCNVVKIY